jgi:hypothetical protein
LQIPFRSFYDQPATSAALFASNVCLFWETLRVKTSILALLLCLITLPLTAQEETLIAGDIESGGFGGPVVKFGSVNGEAGIIVGGRGGWIINHTFILGGGGYGLANNIKAKVPGPFGERYLNFGYGGVELEYIAQSDKLLHFSVMTLIGAGGLGWRDETMRPGSNSEGDGFFILEPAAQVNLNVTKYFRISAGVSYRYVSGVDSPAATDANLSGPTGVLTFRFGKF